MAGSVSISFHGIAVRASSRLTRRGTGLRQHNQRVPRFLPAFQASSDADGFSGCRSLCGPRQRCDALSPKQLASHRARTRGTPSPVAHRHPGPCGNARRALAVNALCSLHLQSKRSKKKVIGDFENGDGRALRQRPLLSTDPCDGAEQAQGSCL